MTTMTTTIFLLLLNDHYENIAFCLFSVISVIYSLCCITKKCLTKISKTNDKKINVRGIFKGALSDMRQFLADESPLKMMKDAS